MTDEDIRRGRGVIPLVDIIFTGILWLSIALLAIAVFLLGEGAYFVLTAESVEGTVVDRTYEPGVDLGTWAPVVDFTTKDGQRLRVAQEEHGSAFYEKGDKITVLYHPDEPEAARFPTYAEFFDIPVVLLIMAAVLFGFRWIMYFALSLTGRALLAMTAGVDDPSRGEAPRDDAPRDEVTRAEPAKTEPARVEAREYKPVVQRSKR